MDGRRPATFARMGLRDSLKKSVRKVVDRFSGEYSAAQSEIRQPPPPSAADAAAAGGDVKVTRARLNRPK
jgi:hypothetical protein